MSCKLLQVGHVRRNVDLSKEGDSTLQGFCMEVMESRAKREGGEANET